MTHSYLLCESDTKIAVCSHLNVNFANQKKKNYPNYGHLYMEQQHFKF